MAQKFLSLAALLLLPLTLRAADPASRPAAGDDTTPLGLIRSNTDSVAAGGATAARSRMSVQNPAFNDFANQLAALQAASAKLNAAVAAQWGPTAAADLSHALGSVAPSDADTATITTTDDHAEIHWKYAKTPTFLILVAGHWKFDLDRMLASMDAPTLAKTQTYYTRLTTVIDSLTQQYHNGDFKSADDLTRHARLAVEKLAASSESP